MTVFLLAWLALCSPAAAYEPPVPIPVSGLPLETITFSRLVIRDQDGNILGTATEQFRIHVLEQLRELGYNVKGAENVLFDQDASSEARFQLGGTVNDIQCENTRSRAACEVAIEWQLFDSQARQVVYKTTTRGYMVEETAFGHLSSEGVGQTLYRTLDSLLARPLFVDALRVTASTAVARPEWASTLSMKRCDRAGITLPKDIEQAMQTTVEIRAGVRTGAGVLVSSDGFLFTAAHVVSGATEVEVTTRNGMKLPGTVLRVDSFQDVALVKMAGAGHACTPLAPAVPPIGEDLFAIGAPAGQSFSLAKGVVSATRTFDDMTFVQTDAAINPGNSGGPLYDSKGLLVGVVSWKIAAPGFEGLGFGVPAQTVAERLGARFDAVSTPNPQAEAPRADAAAVIDANDPTHVGEISIVALAPPKPPKPPKPSKPPLTAEQKFRRSGAALAVVGGTAVLGSWGFYLTDPQVSGGEWTGMKAANAVGWGTTIGGAALFGWGVFGAKGDDEALTPEVSVYLAPNGAGIVGAF